MAHILLVEDDSNLALGLKTALRTAGYTVESVGDGEAALRRAQQRNFDLILLDIKLPPKEGYTPCDQEGYGLCDELRRDGNTTPILMLTANSSEPQRVFGFEVGADDYVIKPFRALIENPMDGPF
jgi:DNA-binding response OmpR family regulator